jgi:hypothetical protein
MNDHAPEGIPTPRPSFQRRKGTTIPRIKDLGPRHRAKKGCSRDAARQNLCPHPRRTEGTANLHRRTPEEGIHRTLEEPLCSAVLLHQKEGWETQTSSGLPTTERVHHPKPLPTTPHTRAHQSSTRRSAILKVRRTLGIQQHTHQNRRPMESGIHHQRRTI